MTAAAAMLGVVTYGVWKAFDTAFGRGLIGQLLSVGVGLTAGAVVYGVAVHAMRIPEARQIERLLMSRIRRSAA
jgi:hypothetical protein